MGQLLLLVHVENLKDVSLATFNRRPQGHDIFFEMHDASIDLSPGPSDNVELIEQLDGGELGGAILIGVTNGDVPL